MIGCVSRKMSVVDAFFCLLLIVPLPQKKITSTADSFNITQCVLQDNDRGLNFGCSGIADSMTWIRVGYYGRTPSSSPSNFCERPDAPPAGACAPDPSGDRRNMGLYCLTYSNCQIFGKNYSTIVAMCPSSNGGFPFAYVSYECLPRKQLDGNYINMITLRDSSPVYQNLYGKIYFWTFGYPSQLTNESVRFQVTVDGNTKVSIRVLDAYGRRLNATGPCSYSLYLYSSSTNIYREWCVTETSWTIDSSIPVVFPAALQGSGTGSASRSQDIDIVFTKTNASLDAEGALWMLVDAVNVADNSPGRNITVSCGSSFSPQVRPTATSTTATTTTPSTTTTTSTTPTPTTTSTTTTPTTISTTTSTTTTPTTTTPTTTTPTTTTPTTTSSTTTTTTSLIATPTPTTSKTTPTPSPITFSATSSYVTSTSVTSRTQEITSSDTTEPFVFPPTVSLNPSSTTTEKATVNNTSEAVELPSQKTNVIIGVVVAVVGVVIIIVIVIVVAVIYRCNTNGKLKPHPPVVIDLDSIITNNNINDDVAASKVAASLRSREHIYDEIHDPLDTMKTVSHPPQHNHPTSPTILRTGRGQSHKVNGVRVRFTTPGGDHDMIFYPGALSNISDDDKANRQTAQNANEVHPRLIKDSSTLKKLSLSSRQKSVPSEAADPAAAVDSGVQLNPVYGFRPADIYMY